ncbi:TPA: type II toxin-antitoxin system YafQ family toxin [Legionella pneumophila]|nr:type II toxin-antitoxin system YafQ family toxin [Legionella pneumophila]HCX3330768.1 type II toxin-antitoxin system YafQ family toxin [Legionella pneumophila]
MLELELSTQFKRDLKKISKQGKNRKLLDSIIEQLQKEEVLDPRHKDHNLSGNWNGYRECHVTPDWLLIYKVIKDDCLQLLRLSRTGSHSDLFK